MSSTGTSHRLGIQKQQRRLTTPPQGGIPPDTLVTPGNYGGLFVSKDALTLIVNNISKLTKQPVSAGEANSVIHFLKRLPGTPYYNRTLEDSCALIAREYLGRRQTELNALEENGDVGKLAGLEENGPASLTEYQKKEIMQATGNENPLAYRAFPNRRGNAVIDQQRVQGLRSSPDSVAPDASLPYGPRGPAGPISNNGTFDGRTGGDGRGGLGSDEALKVLIPAVKLIEQQLDPENLESLLQRSRNLYNTYDNISLVRQTVLFDSRNSLINSPPNMIRWNIHTSGQQGQLGAIRMEDTLQNFVSVTLRPFWIPIAELTDDYYNTLHMDIKELTNQHVPVTEYLDPDERNAETSFYCFELRIRERQVNRLYVVPKNPTFRLRNPVRRLESLTVEFRTPFQVLQLQPDRVTFTMVYGNPTALVSSVPHNINTGDLIYIFNSNSGNAAIDARLKQRQGWFATRVDDLTITISLDTSALAGGQNGIRTYLGSKRISFEIEFTSLDA